MHCPGLLTVQVAPVQDSAAGKPWEIVRKTDDPTSLSGECRSSEGTDTDLHLSKKLLTGVRGASLTKEKCQASCAESKECGGFALATKDPEDGKPHACYLYESAAQVNGRPDYHCWRKNAGAAEVNAKKAELPIFFFRVCK